MLPPRISAQFKRDVRKAEKRAFARSMLADGFAPEVIAKHSALPLSEVQALARQQEPQVGHS